MVCLPEYELRHSWNHEEHLILCVMWRWFERQSKDFARIFNEYFGHNLGFNKICQHYEIYIRFHGGKAFPAYQAVFSVPFNDPRNEFYDLREAIEKTAAMMNIDLKKLKVEGIIPILVEKASEEKSLTYVRSPINPRGRAAHPFLDGSALRMEPETEEFEAFTDTGETTFVSEKNRTTKLSDNQYPQSLAFRVFDARSWTYWGEQGFVAGRYALQDQSYPGPPERSEIERLAASHFSRDGGESSFVSLITSLLQTLSKASNLDRPRLALVDLSLINKPDECFHAAELLSDLKARGECRFARYRGQYEFLIWANIPRAAVIHEFSLMDLINLYEHDENVAALLDLDIFIARTSTKDLGKTLRTKGTTLRATTAAVMGKIVALMFGPNSYSLRHVTDLIARLVDGWKITEISPQETDAAACAFSAHLSSHVHASEDLAGAFLQGVETGTNTIQAFGSH